MNKNRLKQFAQNTLFVIAVVIVLYIFSSHLIHHSLATVSKEYEVSCSTTGDTHTIKINESGFFPEKTEVKACDTILFSNTGKLYHEPAFGEHPTHLIYPGYKEIAIPAGKSNSVILTALGQYQIHDHIYEELEGEITVVK